MRLSRYLLAALPVLTSSLAPAGERPNFNLEYGSTPVRTIALGHAQGTGPLPSRSGVVSRDERRGLPTMLWAQPSSQALPNVQLLPPEQAARAWLRHQASKYRLSAAALDAAELVQVHDIGRGGRVVVLRQRAAGIEVFRNDIKVLMNRAGDLVAIGGNLHPAAVSSKTADGFVRHEAEALTDALRDLYGLSIPTAAIVDLQRTKGDYRYFDLASTPATGGYRLAVPARVKRVWFPVLDQLIPAYVVVVVAGLASETTSDAYQYAFAADDGRLLYRENLTHSDVFKYRVWAEPDGDLRPKDGPIADFSPHPSGNPDGTYPSFTDPVLVSVEGLNGPKDPWLPSGATESRGNNVDAYTDDDAPDGFSSKDTRASVTAPGTFDRVFDTSAGPLSSADQKMAAVTQIFYVNNWLHDYWYDSGFNEAAGNAQKDNYGRGGYDGDPMRAEAQDGAPVQRNNADMSALPDGDSPRMQMFIWDGRSTASLEVQPGNQKLQFRVAEFSPTSFNVSGSLVLADDGAAPASDVCQDVVNDVSGRIVVIDRGTCTFKSKAVRAAAAGAAGVIIVDNQSGSEPPPMGDGDPPGAISIPVVSVTLASGKVIKAAIQAGGASSTLSRTGESDRDGTIDNTIVAHEWGHYIHLRQVACGSPACSAESEGWGDFFALHMVVREGDNLDGTFGLSQYATASFPDDPAYFGIRRFPYSVDFSKNALTFKHITSGQVLPAATPVASTMAGNDNAESHAAGEIWASMLFESYVALLKRSQGPNPPYNFEQARRRMADYVEAGLKLAPVDPTFTEQRDAILAAAAASDIDDLQVMAAAFAKRGAGTCAVSPPRDSFDFQGVVESFTVEPNVAIVSVTLDDKVKACDTDGHLNAGETGNLTIEVMNKGTAPVSGAAAVVSSKLEGALFPKGTTVQFGDILPFASATAVIEVGLAPTLTKKANFDLAVSLTNAGSCANEDTLQTAPLVNYDEVPNAAAIDTVEPSATAWVTKGANASAIWSRTEPSPGNHVWSGIDFSSPSDTWLLSPPLQVKDGQNLVLNFDHRHLFEESKGVTWDGSVIEVSTDDGKTWEDISKYGDPGYEGQIGDPTDQAQNALKGRQGYVGKSASWPAMQNAKVDLGTSLAGKTIRVRFRVASDDAAGDYGWELDNIAFEGIANTPFPAMVDKVSGCGPAVVEDAGPDQDAGSDLTDGNPEAASDAGQASTQDPAESVGGGGCDCATPASGSSGWPAGLISALALFGIVRRRRHREDRNDSN